MNKRMQANTRSTSRVSGQDSDQLRKCHGSSGRCEHQRDAIQLTGYDFLRELSGLRVPSCIWNAGTSHCEVSRGNGCPCKFLTEFLLQERKVNHFKAKLTTLSDIVGHNRGMYVGRKELGRTCHNESPLGSFRECCGTKLDAHYHNVVQGW